MKVARYEVPGNVLGDDTSRQGRSIAALAREPPARPKPDRSIVPGGTDPPFYFDPALRTGLLSLSLRDRSPLPSAER
jgi:hypothetical protein